MSNRRILHLNESNFEALVLNAKEPVLVDFWAAWCGPCHAIAPVVERLAERFGGKVGVGQLDVDENEEVAQRYRVRSIPTLVVFKHGALVAQVVGAASEEEIAAMLERALDRDDPTRDAVDEGVHPRMTKYDQGRVGES